MNYVLKGQCVEITNDRTVELKEGDLCLLAPNVTHGIKAAILAVNLWLLGTMALSSVISDISEYFTGVSDQVVQFLMTAPGLFILFTSLLSAYMTAIISKKRLTLVGIILTLISAAGGLLFHESIVLLYVWAALLGQVSSAQNLGAIVMTVGGGLFATIHWHLVYLVYFIAVPGMILTMLFIPDEQPVTLKNSRKMLLRVLTNYLCGRWASTAPYSFFP
jgi:hypothetical protein